MGLSSPQSFGQSFQSTPSLAARAAAAFYGRRAVFARLDQTTLAMDTRVNVTFTPDLSLELFAQRNFAVGNAATLAIYGGLGTVPFFLVLFLQQVAGYTPLQAGVALLPVSVIMFTLSRRWGAMADRIVFMTGGTYTGAGRAFLDRVTNLRLEKPFDHQTLRALVAGIHD